MSHEMSGLVAKSRNALLAWYDQKRRDLPWRRTSDPYPILLSEFMLQQTRVETVIPYFHRFLDRFPDLGSLAAAEVDEVLALWSGLGYYSRARRLHALARALVERGSWPRRAAELIELPGIGPYTAAAIGSIAFGDAVAVVDGNVERILSRLDALETIAKSAAGRRSIATRAEELLDRDRPGDFNQAMMELGATVCSPRKPRCEACPWTSFCAAHAAGRMESFPVKAEKRTKTVLVSWTMLIVRKDDRVLLFRRPHSDELLAGTWELPWVESRPEGLETLFDEGFGGRFVLGRELGSLRHSITHRRIVVEVREAEWSSEGEIAEGREAGFFDQEERDRLPLSSLVGKVLKKESR